MSIKEWKFAMTLEYDERRLNEKKEVKQVNFLEKNPQIVELEHLLINYLSSKKDIEDKISGGRRRIRALMFNINSSDILHPYFSVQIGMCEAIFNTQTGLKERGSCFGLERMVRDWFERPSIQSKINDIVKQQIIKIKKNNAA